MYFIFHFTNLNSQYVRCGAVSVIIVRIVTKNMSKDDVILTVTETQIVSYQPTFNDAAYKTAATMEQTSDGAN
jgi:hypothetical protein